MVFLIRVQRQHFQALELTVFRVSCMDGVGRCFLWCKRFHIGVDVIINLAPEKLKKDLRADRRDLLFSLFNLTSYWFFGIIGTRSRLNVHGMKPTIFQCLKCCNLWLIGLTKANDMKNWPLYSLHGTADWYGATDFPFCSSSKAKS